MEEGDVFAEAVEQRPDAEGNGLDSVSHEGEFGAFETGEAALAEFQENAPAGGFGSGGLGLGEDRGGEDAFGQVVDAAVVVAAGDEQAAVEEEFLQSRLGERGGAPNAAAATVIVEVSGRKRSTRGDFREERGGEILFPGREPAGPGA